MKPHPQRWGNKAKGPHHKTRPQFSRLKFGKKTEGLKQVDGKDLRAPHLSCLHTPSSNKIHKITPMEALYKFSRIVQMKLVIIIRSKWVEILVLS